MQQNNILANIESRCELEAFMNLKETIALQDGDVLNPTHRPNGDFTYTLSLVGLKADDVKYIYTLVRKLLEI